MIREAMFAFLCVGILYLFVRAIRISEKAYKAEKAEQESKKLREEVELVITEEESLWLKYHEKLAEEKSHLIEGNT